MSSPINNQLLSKYQTALAADFLNQVKHKKFDGKLKLTTTAAAVYSSNIEGNTLDLNSFMNKRQWAIKTKPKEMSEIEDLETAYQFAQENLLTETNWLETHQISSSTLLPDSDRGHYRQQPVGVFGAQGLIYLAVEPEHVPKLMSEFFITIKKFLEQKLTPIEVFYYAAWLHLRLVHIHPFADGNGRAARLLEKWFLASKLGKNWWQYASEAMYLEQRSQYYQNLNLGVNFYEIKYQNALLFLLMLPSVL